MPPSQRRRLSDFSEFHLIQAIARGFGSSPSLSLLKGIGDDASIIQPRPDHNWLVSTDLLIEGIHFDLRFASFYDIGYRAAVANLSDIAAMGGIPKYLLIALAIPPHYSMLDLQALYRGLLSPCRPHRVQLIGGDTSTSRKDIFLSVTILGTIEPNRALPRNGAQIGDHIYTTGTLGDSSAGLALLQSKKKSSKQLLGHRTSMFLINRHLRPTPRLEMGRLLARYQLANAAIDLSDGLSGDLTHLCRESGVGALIEINSIPFSPQYRTFHRQMGQHPLEMALQGGEDYELLFTVPEHKHSQLKRLVKRKNLPITWIGTIQPRKLGIRLKLDSGKYRKITEKSYDHFRKKKSSVG